MKPDKAQFYADVYNIVAQIPTGRVLTYGRIAELMGWPNHSRMVGRALREVPEQLHLPCHRVVNGSGRTAPAWVEQPQLLAAEGVKFKGDALADATRRVDLATSLWDLTAF